MRTEDEASVRRDSADYLLLCAVAAAGQAEILHWVSAIDLDPFDRRARLCLLGAWDAPRSVQLAQLVWFARFEPTASLAKHAHAALSADGARDEPLYTEVASAWRDAATSADDLRTLSNAAHVLLSFDPLEGACLLASKPSRDSISQRAARASILLADALALGIDVERLREACILYGATSLRLDDGDDEERTFSLICTLVKLVPKRDPAYELLKEASRARATSDPRENLRERLRFARLAAEALTSRH